MMLKKAIGGFIILVAILAVIDMYDHTSEMAASKAQDVLARPDGIKELQRIEVREACTKNADWFLITCQRIDQNKIAVGMTADQVRLSWGKPRSINSTIVASGMREQWVYGGDYVYLDDGIVRSMQSSSRP
jgi:hypothetical protein